MISNVYMMTTKRRSFSLSRPGEITIQFDRSSRITVKAMLTYKEADFHKKYEFLLGDLLEMQ